MTLMNRTDSSDMRHADNNIFYNIFDRLSIFYVCALACRTVRRGTRKPG